MDVKGWLAVVSLGIGAAGIITLNLQEKVHRKRVNGDELDEINRVLSLTRKTRLQTARSVYPSRDTACHQIRLTAVLMKDTPVEQVVATLSAEEDKLDSVSRVFVPHPWDRDTHLNDPSKSTWMYFVDGYVEQW